MRGNSHDGVGVSICFASLLELLLDYRDRRTSAIEGFRAVCDLLCACIQAGGEIVRLFPRSVPNLVSRQQTDADGVLVVSILRFVPMGNRIASL